MAFTVQTRLEIKGDGQFARVAERLRNPRPLMKKVGVLMMSSALGRLPKVLRQGGDVVRSGRLSASIRAGVSGRAGRDTVFRLSDTRVQVGSNLPYAAQVHFGGTILPKKGKALAIPLLARLQRQGMAPADFPKGALDFVPAKRKSGGLIGFLVDADERAGTLAGKRRKRDLSRRTALFMLVAKVTQRPRPYLFFDAQDEADIDKMLVDHLEGK